MSLTRYAPQMFESFRQPVRRPARFALSLAVGAVLVVAGQAAHGAGFAGAGQAGMLLTALGMGAAGFLWSVAVAGSDAPVLSPIQMMTRLLAWTMGFQALEGVQMVASILLGALFAGMADADVYARAGGQIFQMLIGCFYLALPQLALGAWRDLGGTRLQEMVAVGGVAVGLCFVIITLPFMAASDLARGLYLDFAPAAVFAAAITGPLIHLLWGIIAAGYLVLVWRRIREVAAERAEDVADPAKPDRPRRTTRITRESKARR